MADDHIIRVIIQGYNKLSGVLKDAVGEAGPQLDKLNTKLRNNRREADNTADSFTKLRESMERGSSRLDVVGSRVDRLSSRIKNLNKQTKEYDETAAQMFDRLRKEGNSPRQGAGFSPFVSKQDFIQQENERRRQENQSFRQRFTDTKNKVFQGLSPIDDVFRGFQKGAQRADGTGTIASRAQIELERELARLRAEESDKLAAVNREAAIRRKEAVDAALKENSAIRNTLAAEDSRLDKLRSQKELENQILTIKKRSERTTALAGVEGTGDEARAAREKIKIDVASEIAARDAALKEEVRKIESERSRLHREALANIEQEKSTQIAAANEIATRNRNSVRETFRESRRVARESFSTNKDNLPALIARQERESRQSINNISSGFERISAKAGKLSSDLSYGFRGGRKGLKELEDEAGSAQSVFTQFGAGIGRATKDVNRLVNVKWNLIIGALQVFGTLAVEAGANLISLASSAVFAAGALGGAFIAAVAQAIPVVGLLAATFQELQNAIKVVQLRQKANNSASVDAAAQAKAQKTAVQQLADAHYALKQAQQGVIDANRGIRDSHERVTDAIRAQKDATQGLADARKQATRAIVDAAFAERDAELSVKDAQLAVLDAKQKLKDFEDKRRADQSGLKDAQAAVKEAQQRLAAAKAEGDAAEIAAATSQLSIAGQNVGAIQDQISQTTNDHQKLVLGIKEAQLAEQKAVVTRSRARQDNAVRQRQGVEGSPEVKAALDTQRNAARQYRDAVEGVTAAQQRRVDAEHNVAQAIRGIANAQDDVTAASGKMSAAQRNAQREFNKLSLPERQFVLAAERLVKAWKQTVRPLTDIITESITRLISSLISIISDPQIQAALHRLATAIGNGIDRIGAFLKDPETRRQLLTFIDEAAKNMPTVVNLFLRLLKIVGDIGEAAAPIFSTLLGGADSLLGRAERRAAPRKSTTNSRDPRVSRLEPPGQTTPGATTTPNSPLQSFLEIASKNLTSWLRLIGAITRFFTYLFGGAQPSGNSLVAMLTTAFNKWADWLRDHPEKVRKFFEEMRVSIGKVAGILGHLAEQLVRTFSSKNAQAYTEFLLTVVVPALLIMLGIIQAVTGWFVALTKIPGIGPVLKDIVTFTLAASFLAKLFPILKPFPQLMLNIGKAFLYTIGFMGRFIAVAREVGIAEALMALPFSVWLILAAAVVVAVILILRHFHLLGPLAHFIQGVWNRVVSNLKTFVSDFKELLTHPIRWLQDHWKQLLIAGIMGPFYVIVRTLGLFFPGFQKAIFDGFIGAFKKIGDWFRGVGAWLNTHVIKPIERFFGIASPSTLMFKLGMNVVNGFLNAIKKLPNLVVEVFKKIPGLVLHLFDDLGGKVAKTIYKALPGPVRKALGGTEKAVTGAVGWAGRHLAGGGSVDNRGGIRGVGMGTDTVPAWLTPGEWVLNKSQQLQVSRRLGLSVEAMKMMLFGSGGFSPGTGTVSGNTVSENGRWQGYRNLDLHTSTDDNGNEVHFIRFKDGTWGQVTGRAAARIAATNGSWTPGYANRSARLHGGFTINPSAIRRAKGLRSDAFDRRFAMGGVVSAMSAGSGIGPKLQGPAGGGNTVNQNFNVNSEGESDWNGIMRIGAVHAQEAY